ncbi:hypothetical protein IMSAGC001_01513 [Bacteroides acidifaciens]|uniref:Uncharacterized protein n=1 Tax=Bacteroides acidifaciens TaxID=85831 RepID=A0A7J0A1F3_9BACE|nr:hypothetical protein IMSAGC001_01513 [Bacteroides acidifaciens]
MPILKLLHYLLHLLDYPYIIVSESEQKELIFVFLCHLIIVTADFDNLNVFAHIENKNLSSVPIVPTSSTSLHTSEMSIE